MVHYLKSGICECGREHSVAVDDVIIGSGVIAQLPAFLKKYNAKKLKMSHVFCGILASRR